MFYNKKFDVIIVGAGPGGSIAAKEAAEKGLKVLVLERDKEVGLPVRCAEGVGKRGLLEFFDEDHWLVQRYLKTLNTRFVAPDGTAVDVHYQNEGAIFDRKVFDCELARMAALAGAQIITMCNVMGIVKNSEGNVSGVEVIYQGKRRTIESKIVIAADGVETRVGRWAGIDTTPNFNDLESCVQFTMTNLDIDSNRTDFYFGDEVAPAGYLWVFPKSDKTANVGLGIRGDWVKQKKKAIDYLNEFVEKTFPEASILATTCGGVICSETLKQISTGGLMIVGDAAHMTNAISGGGIINAMKGGRVAAKIAVEACEKNDFSGKFLKRYDKEWNKVQGKMNHKFNMLKESIDGIKDETLNKIAAKLNKLPTEKRTIIQVFKTALINHPKLILDLPKMFA